MADTTYYIIFSEDGSHIDRLSEKREKGSTKISQQTYEEIMLLLRTGSTLEQICFDKINKVIALDTIMIDENEKESQKKKISEDFGLASNFIKAQDIIFNGGVKTILIFESLLAWAQRTSQTSVSLRDAFNAHHNVTLDVLQLIIDDMWLTYQGMFSARADCETSGKDFFIDTPYLMPHEL